MTDPLSIIVLAVTFAGCCALAYHAGYLGGLRRAREIYDEAEQRRIELRREQAKADKPLSPMNQEMMNQYFSAYYRQKPTTDPFKF